MLDSSLEFKEAIRENTKCYISAYLDFANGTTLSLTGSDFMANTVSFDDSTSSSESFDIGAAVMKSFSCTLNNLDGKFNGYDFTNAVIRPTVKKDLSSSTELIGKGRYIVESPSSIGSTISITAYDDMTKLEKPYSSVSTTYPATLQKILNDVCTYCGIVLNTLTFSNYNYTISTRPDSSTLTCLDVVSYIAQIAGCYARIDIQGRLNLLWYDLNAFDRNLIDGGTFNTITTTYADGSVLDGGDFAFGSSSSADGGNFTDSRPYQIYAFSSFEVTTDDVVITGIKTVVDDTEYLYGSNGYVLSVEDNPFITASNMNAIAMLLGGKIIGMRFRPFSVSALSDPTLEAGDAVAILKDGGIYFSYVTHTSYKMGQYQAIECNAETPSANSSTSYSASTVNYVKARENAAKQISAYDVQMQLLTNLMVNSFGTFKTEVVQSDGSIIYYMHNKPTLAASSTIWKMTADAFAVSTDGGVTWNAGFDSSGNVVVNVLSAIGINADWINTGSIIIGGTSGNINGSITMKNSSNSIIGTWNKNGLSMTSGSINLGDGNFIVTQAGKVTINDGSIKIANAADSGIYARINDGSVTVKSYDSANSRYVTWVIGDSDGGLLATNSSYSFFIGENYIGGTGTFYIQKKTEIMGALQVDGSTSVVGKIYSNGFGSEGNIYPSTDNVYSNGTSSYKWTSVYATNGTIQTSDRNKKHDIKEISEVYERLFLNIVPVSYVLNDGDRIHIGAISQDIETAMKELGLSDLDFAGFCKDIHYIYDKTEDGKDIESSKYPQTDEDGNIVYDYSLRYQEFIMLTVHMVQKQQLRIETLESTVKQQGELIKALCEKVGVEYGNSNA